MYSVCAKACNNGGCARARHEAVAAARLAAAPVRPSILHVLGHGGYYTRLLLSSGDVRASGSSGPVVAACAGPATPRPCVHATSPPCQRDITGSGL
jgi:hypothetical protein